MISLNDQEMLFRLIAKHLPRDVTCWAFGGTAMMYLGFKEVTKDIDLLFEDETGRDAFIEAIKNLGFKETSPAPIYAPEKLKEKKKPLMFRRGDTRLDLFATKVFRTTLSAAMKKGALHEYRNGQTLKIVILRPEHLVYLKGITGRAKDLDDIRTIINKEREFDWDVLINEAIWQHGHGDTWALLDTERTLRELQEQTFIEEQYFKRLYAAQEVER